MVPNQRSHEAPCIAQCILQASATLGNINHLVTSSTVEKIADI